MSTQPKTAQRASVSPSRCRADTMVPTSGLLSTGDRRLWLLLPPFCDVSLSCGSSSSSSLSSDSSSPSSSSSLSLRSSGNPCVSPSRNSSSVCGRERVNFSVETLITYYTSYFLRYIRISVLYANLVQSVIVIDIKYIENNFTIPLPELFPELFPWALRLLFL